MEPNQGLIIRAYRKSDREAILDLLRLNTPAYFSPKEQGDLEYYLENEIEQYFVIEIESQIVGSGGFNFSQDKTTGIISWDLIHPGFQGRSLGSALLNFRIKELQKCEGVSRITVRTSQLVSRFYEKLGFRIIEVVEDYWDEGFHLVRMEYAPPVSAKDMQD